MLVIPAIDLHDGMCVRLRKGDFETAHKVAEDPIGTAEAFKAAGAELLHVVDLDGALLGNGRNTDIVAALSEKSGMRLELGGGLRSMAALERADEIGVYRFVIGSAAVSDPDFVKAAVDKYGERVAVGIDAMHGEVMTAGWTKGSGVDAFAFAARMSALGVGLIIYTDISTDGMLTGPALGDLEKLKSTIGCKITASGGVSSIDDLLKIKALGLYGAIVGKAVYTGDVALKEAIEQCR